MHYQLQDVLVVPKPIEEVWSFFSDPRNLPLITPPDLGFKIISDPGNETFPGLIIRYQVTPLLGVPLEWVSEITHVVPEQLFVDEQRFGPYAFWHHLHRFRSEGSTTVVEDVVNYRLPMGVLGRIVHPFIVRPKLERIFRYRRSVVEQLMGTATTQLMS